MVNKKENMDKVEQLKKEKSDEIMVKLEEFEKRKNDTVQKRSRKLHQMIVKQEKNYEKLLQNKNTLRKEKDNLNQFVLETQLSLLNRANLKENSVNLNRLNAYENTILTQMELEKKLSSFHSQMNALKDKSVYKKSYDQRKEIYLELKRKEEEKRKKEEEERKKKLEML